MTPIEVFAAQPAGLKAWLLWLFTINVLSVLFVRRIEARWVLGAMLLNLAGMTTLLALCGGGHHMSLPHVVLWTPLLVYLVFRAPLLNTQPKPYAAWLGALSVSNAISLAFDYVNVARLVLA
jgi:hypothetical protein